MSEGRKDDAASGLFAMFLSDLGEADAEEDLWVLDRPRSASEILLHIPGPGTPAFGFEHRNEALGLADSR